MGILRLMGILLLIIFVTIIGSKPVYNENFAIITGSFEDGAVGQMSGSIDVNYPDGFTENNTIVIGLMSHGTLHTDWWSTTGYPLVSTATTRGNGNLTATLKPNNITVSSQKIDSSANPTTITFKLVLMKLPTGNESSVLGDVNLDGQVTEDDKTLLQGYIRGNNGLTGQQYANADMDKNGEVDAIDLTLLQRELNN